MLNNSIFHERCSLAFGIVSDIECLHIVMFTFVYCLSIVVEKSYIFQNLWHFFKKKLDGCLQPCRLVNVLKAYLR